MRLDRAGTAGFHFARADGCRGRRETLRFLGEGFESFHMFGMGKLDVEACTIGAYLAFDEMGGTALSEVSVIGDEFWCRIVFFVCTNVFVNLVHGLEIGG